MNEDKIWINKVVAIKSRNKKSVNDTLPKMMVMHLTKMKKITIDLFLHGHAGQKQIWDGNFFMFKSGRLVGCVIIMVA